MIFVHCSSSTVIARVSFTYERTKTSFICYRSYTFQKLCLRLLSYRTIIQQYFVLIHFNAPKSILKSLLAGAVSQFTLYLLHLRQNSSFLVLRSLPAMYCVFLYKKTFAVTCSEDPNLGIDSRAQHFL